MFLESASIASEKNWCFLNRSCHFIFLFLLYRYSNVTKITVQASTCAEVWKTSTMTSRAHEP